MNNHIEVGSCKKLFGYSKVNIVMANLNVDYSKGLFADTNTVLTEVERAQLANLRDITQNFSNIMPLDKLLSLDQARLANVPDNTLMAGPLMFLSSVPTTETNPKLACTVADSVILSIANNNNTNYTVFTSSTALDSFSMIVKDLCNALVKDLRPEFISDPSVIVNLANSITESIDRNVSAFSPYSDSGILSLDAFVQECASNSKMYINNNLGHFDIVKQRQILTTYVIAFYPFMISRYITAFIRTAGDAEASAKPTSFIVRQFAILTLKVYLVQMILLLIQRCTTTSVRTTLKSAIRTLLFSISSEYNTQEEFEAYYQEILQLASQNKDIRSTIEAMSKDVTAARNNVEKALVNDQRAKSLVGRQKMLMYIWLALLVILSLAAIALLVVGTEDNGLFYYLYVLCAIFVISVFINGLIQVVRG